MAGLKDYYKIFGVAPNASDDEINKKFKEYAKELHPDKNESLDDKTKQEREEEFKIYTDAYSHINPKNRPQYHPKWNTNFNFGTNKNPKYETYQTGNRNNYENSNDTHNKNKESTNDMNKHQAETPYSFAEKFAKSYKGDPSRVGFDPEFRAGIAAAYKAKQKKESDEQRRRLEEQEERINPKLTEEEKIERKKIQNERNAKKASLEKRINTVGAITITTAALVGAYIGLETNGELFQYIGNALQSGAAYIANHSPNTIAEYANELSKLTIPDYVNKAADIVASMGIFATAAYSYMGMKAESVAEKYKSFKIKTEFN